MSPAIFMAVLLTAVALSYLWGERDEHMACATMVFASFLTPLAASYTFSSAELTIFAIDVVVLAILVVISLYSDRYWTLFAAGFQLANVSVHLGIIVSPLIVPAAYANALAIWSYLVVTALITGILFERRSLRYEK